jgi:hypothetical protein
MSLRNFTTMRPWVVSLGEVLLALGCEPLQRERLCELSYPNTTEAGFMKVNDNAGSQRVAKSPFFRRPTGR